MIADTHYNHGNIVRGCSKWENKEACRNFNTLDEHNNVLVNNINNCVKEDDLLYHLGDFSFRGENSIYEFRKKINCKNIIFIGGNHDHHIRKNIIINTDYGDVNAQSLFKEYHELLEKKIGNTTFIFCHYPIHSFHKMKNENTIHAYGHTHLELNYNKKAVCVSVDCHPEFRPFHIDEIRQILNKREIYKNH